MAVTDNEKPSGAGKLLAVFAVLGVVGLIVATQRSTSSSSATPVSSAAIPAASPAPVAPANAADDVAADEAPPVAPAYAPPSSTQVDKAVSEGFRVYKAEGLSGLSHYGQQCYATLFAAPTYKGLDFCLAFDVFATSLAQSVDASLTQTADSYFAKHQQRALAAGAYVMNGSDDAAARLVDVRTLVSNAVAERARLAEATATTPATVSEAPASPN